MRLSPDSCRGEALDQLQLRSAVNPMLGLNSMVSRKAFYLLFGVKEEMIFELEGKKIGRKCLSAPLK